jgi:hypothetical protein
MTTNLTHNVKMTFVSATKDKRFYKLTFEGIEFMRIHTTAEDRTRREFTGDLKAMELFRKAPELASMILAALYGPLTYEQ